MHPTDIDCTDFDTVVKKLRLFFQEKGYIEVHTQSRLSILAACEDPNTISTYNYAGQVWPLPQTGQMWLEYELLKNPKLPGVFCVSTSFRNEPNPIPGRHDLIFPMFEFEMHGGINDLLAMEKELVEYLGFNPPYITTYDEMAEKYNVKELEHEHEQKMYQDFGDALCLTYFPTHTSPFWNMKLHDDKQHAHKIDVIMCGMETIGSAERSTSKEEMRHMFNTISNGKLC